MEPVSLGGAADRRRPARLDPGAHRAGARAVSGPRRVNLSSRKRFQGVGRQNLQLSRDGDIRRGGSTRRRAKSALQPSYLMLGVDASEAIPFADSIFSIVCGSISGRFARAGRIARARDARPPCRDGAPPGRAGRERAQAAFGRAARPGIRFDPFETPRLPQLPSFVHFLFSEMSASPASPVVSAGRRQATSANETLPSKDVDCARRPLAPAPAAC